MGQLCHDVKQYWFHRCTAKLNTDFIQQVSTSDIRIQHDLKPTRKVQTKLTSHALLTHPSSKCFQEAFFPASFLMLWGSFYASDYFFSEKDQKSLELNSQRKKKHILNLNLKLTVSFPPYFSVVGAKLLTSEVKARGAKTLGCCKSPTIWDLLSDAIFKVTFGTHKSNALSLENHLTSTILKGSGFSVPWMVFFCSLGVFAWKNTPPHLESPISNMIPPTQLKLKKSFEIFTVKDEWQIKGIPQCGLRKSVVLESSSADSQGVPSNTTYMAWYSW